MISIHKTKTKGITAKSATNEPYEQKICELVYYYLLDLSWTYLVPDYLYADCAIFMCQHYEQVYSWFNIGPLNTLSSFYPREGGGEQ